jgi:Protein of unknown function (DUF3429)
LQLIISRFHDHFHRAAHAACPWHDHQTVRLTEDGARTTRFNTVAEWAGYAAVLPLLLCLGGVGLLPDYAWRELAQRAAIAWGAVLLASAAAVHWGIALSGRLPWGAARLGAPAAAALIGAIGVVLGGQRGLAVLVVGHGGFWLYERRARDDQLPPAYLSLRRPMTFSICMLLALTMFVSDTAGLV